MYWTDLPRIELQTSRSTMEANSIFESIITLIKSSNLNYRLQQTHFSAEISLKNSVIKDRSGSPLKLLPHPDSDKLNSIENENDRLLRKIRKLENEASDLKVDLNQMKAFAEASNNKIIKLEADLERSSEDVLGQSDQNATLKKSLKSKSEEIKTFKNKLNDSNKIVMEKDKIIDELKAKLERVEGEKKTSKENFNILKKEKHELKREIKSLTSTSLPASSPAHCATSPSISSSSMLDKITKSESSTLEELEHDLRNSCIQYNIETNNNFKILDESENIESRASDEEKVEEKVPKINLENYEAAFKDFLQNFKENLSDSPKYPDVAKQMMHKGYNMFHVSLKDVRSFNPNLGGFLNQNHINLDSEITKIVQSFIKELNLGDLKHGLYFLLISGKR